ncbi:hypothetical protein Goklo_013842 [Gossypium klotzschianum]|uniref:Uncharacterized protein n=1 Tax=Gossypium klotzschianum TaxID=34286 RepID=A0A7J8U5K9_9ROSI|nr:hypothetical protein [Gossypium klotzschianum]
MVVVDVLEHFELVVKSVVAASNFGMDVSGLVVDASECVDYSSPIVDCIVVRISIRIVANVTNVTGILCMLWTIFIAMVVTTNHTTKGRNINLLSDLYRLNRKTNYAATATQEVIDPADALRLIIPDNACILCITTATGTELADAYSPDTIIASSLGKEVHDL